MTDAIKIWVGGVPAPGGSKKAFMNPRTKRIVVQDDCKRNKPWMQRVCSIAASKFREPIQGPLCVSFDFVVTRPKGHYGTGRNASVVKPTAPAYPTVKPDTTKLIRSTEDALTGLAWIDDAQIVSQTGSKRYGDNPGVMITVTRMGAA